MQVPDNVSFFTNCIQQSVHPGQADSTLVQGLRQSATSGG